MRVDDLRARLEYFPESGELRWIERPIGHFRDQRTRASWHARFCGRPAGHLRRDGYLMVTVRIGGERFQVLAHRIAWALFHGRWPADEIDHVNGDPADNRIANLREATRSGNMQNTNRMGVSWNKRDRRWLAKIGLRNKIIRLGYFRRHEDAEAAYLEAKKLHHCFQPTPRGEAP